MKMNKKITFAVIAICLAGGIAWAVSQKSEDQKVWNSYIDTKKSFEKDVHNLLIDKWPKEKSIAQAHLNLELARLDQKDTQFDYIVKKYPGRLDRNKGLDDFADYDWSDKDQNTLTSTDKSYAKLSDEVVLLEKKYNNMENRSDFEGHLKDVKGTVEYRTMTERYHDMVAKLENTWKNIKYDLKN